jgi:hypothetical protein
MRVLGTNGRRTHLCGAPVPVRLNAGTEPHPFQFQLHSKSPTNRSRHQIRSDQRRRRKTRLVSRPPLVRTLTMTALNKTTQTSFPFPLAHATVASAGNLLVCSEKLPDRRAHPSSRGTRPRDEGRGADTTMTLVTGPGSTLRCASFFSAVGGTWEGREETSADQQRGMEAVAFRRSGPGSTLRCAAQARAPCMEGTGILFDPSCRPPSLPPSRCRLPCLFPRPGGGPAATNQQRKKKNNDLEADQAGGGRSSLTYRARRRRRPCRRAGPWSPAGSSSPRSPPTAPRAARRRRRRRPPPATTTNGSTTTPKNNPISNGTRVIGQPALTMALANECPATTRVRRDDGSRGQGNSPWWCSHAPYGTCALERARAEENEGGREQEIAPVFTRACVPA